MSVTDAAKRYGYSRQHLHKLLKAYQQHGISALVERSKRPKGNARAVTEGLKRRIIELRCDLKRQGLDAGPVTIAWHLQREGHQPPSTSTIRRVLHAANLIKPQPQKRPKGTIIRFQAEQPNETWQGDFTHWRLADESTVEIINWLDDHSRLLLCCRAYPRVGGSEVTTTFNACVNEYGTPASTLTDNAVVYTGRFVKGPAPFEVLLARLGITQKNGHPGHPQTQGKIERFHQTLKRHLNALPPAPDLDELQTQLDAFRELYNHHRPHRGLPHRQTPHEAYNAIPKATPTTQADTTHYRVRTDRVDNDGHVSLRRAGKMHHLGVAAKHAGKPVKILIDSDTATVIDQQTGEILSKHTIDPTKSYWRNQLRSPGRWPGTT
jgi:transposase InsO family protein